MPKRAAPEFAPPEEESRVVTAEIRVRYAETDQMGVVHHANYPIWFEMARSEFVRARGINYIQMERDGLALPLLEVSCRYFSPAFYDDLIVVRAWVVECRRSLLRTHYEVRRDDTRLATGHTLQMLIERATGKPRRFDPDIAHRFHPQSPSAPKDRPTGG